MLRRLDIQQWVGPDAEVHVEIVRYVRQYKQWLEEAKVSPQGGLLLDSTGVHCFCFMRRKGSHCDQPEMHSWGQGLGLVTLFLPSPSGSVALH